MNNIVNVENLNHCYGPLEILKGVNFKIQQGQTVAILGKSGSGKSTLLHLLGALDRIESGDISINSQHLKQMNSEQAAVFRRKNIGFIYQAHHLLPDLNALENCMIPLMINRIPKKEAIPIATKILNQVGLGERVLHKPSELSGGERQRVSIARALVTNPTCVLADEPTGNLDTDTSIEIFNLLTSIAKTNSGCLIMVTHDPELAAQMDRQLILTNKTLVERN